MVKLRVALLIVCQAFLLCTAGCDKRGPTASAPAPAASRPAVEATPSEPGDEIPPAVNAPEAPNVTPARDITPAPNLAPPPEATQVPAAAPPPEAPPLTVTVAES